MAGKGKRKGSGPSSKRGPASGRTGASKSTKPPSEESTEAREAAPVVSLPTASEREPVAVANGTNGVDSVPPENEVEVESPTERDDVAEISAYVPDRFEDAPDSGETTRSESSTREPMGDVGDELRAVEAEVDRIFYEQARKPRRGDDGSLSSVVARIREVIPVELPGEDGTLVDAAKDVLSTDYYLRQWGRIGLRNRSEEVDEFGLDPVYEKRLQPFVDGIYRHYFRVETRGIENVPNEGRVILVANHSGVLPYDGIMLRAAMRLEHPRSRELRWLAEDFIFHLPFVGAFMNRIGAVRACQENAERLLRQERAVLVFPEGVKGVGRLYKDRYKLQRFGRGGFIKLALRTKAPIIPVSIVGAEESAPMLYRIEYLTQAIGLPFVPVTPTFPLLGPLGLVPAPMKWMIDFGEPIHLDEHGAEAAEDALLVNRLSDRVRGAIQTSLDRRVASRKSVLFG